MSLFSPRLPFVTSITASLYSLAIAQGGLALAQIVPDGSLPTPSVVVPQMEPDGSLLQQLEGGTTRGANLFHSFSTFNVPSGSTARFENEPAIVNIFTRITGGEISILDGRIQAGGMANVFFLNPRGVLFGPEARLDIDGSFIVSSAERIVFADGTQFAATSPGTEPLLTVSAPVGLGFGTAPGTIVSNANVTLDTSGPFPLAVRSSRVAVPEGQTLGLIGGELELAGGQFLAPAGRIVLGSVAAPATVGLQALDEGFVFDFDGVDRFGDIQLSNLALVDASSERGGAISINGRNVILSEGALVTSITFDPFTGGDITVRATESLQVLGTSTIPGLFEPFIAQGGVLVPLFSFISTDTAAGNAGNIDIVTRRLAIRDGARITANADPNRLPGVEVAGEGGDITVKASESVEITGSVETQLAAPDLPIPPIIVESNGVSFLSTLATVQSERAGDITIETGKLLLSDSGLINTLTLGTADSGNIEIVARDSIVIEGVRSGGTARSGITASVFGVLPDLIPLAGDGGVTRLVTPRLLVRDGGQISSDTSTAGSGGSIEIEATEIEISGQVQGVAVSEIQTASTGSGPAGNLDITADTVTISDGGKIDVAGTAAGPAGELVLSANTLRLDNGRIDGQTASDLGGGSLLLQADNIFLENGSAIATDATGTADSGNITIEANALVGLPAGGNNNDITANAEGGSGGLITLDVAGLFGFQVRTGSELLAVGVQPGNLVTNDVTAFSQEQPEIDEGAVSFLAPEVNPTDALVQFDVESVDVAGEIGRSCAALGEAGLAIVGRGGLPPTPTSFQTGSATFVDLGEGEELPARNSLLNEARGWLTSTDGIVTLMADRSSSPTTLLQIGRHHYRTGNYAAAAEVWETAVADFTSSGDHLNMGRTWGNLALAYAQLGRWTVATRALVRGEDVLANHQLPGPTTEVARLTGQLASTRGNLAWRAGKIRTALSAWEVAADAYGQAGDPGSVTRSQLNQARGLAALGLSLQELQLLEELEIDPVKAPELAATRWQLLGDAHRKFGQIELARAVLQKSLTVAEQTDNRALIASAQLSMGAVWQRSGNLMMAAQFYREAAKRAPQSLLHVQAQLNQLGVFLATGNEEAARRLWPAIASQVDSLPLSRAALYARLKLAGALVDFMELSSISQPQHEIALLLATALSQARELGDETATIWALGYQGYLAEKSGELSQALHFTRQALLAAQNNTALELMYRWQWQLGRLLVAAGRGEEAIAVYDGALETVQSLRSDLAAASDAVEYAFRTEIEPLYRQYADLLLQPNISTGGQVPQTSLKKARQVIEALRLAELDSFFEDDCSSFTPAAIDNLDPGTAVIYPVIFPNRLVTIVGVAGKPLQYYSTAVSAKELERTVAEFFYIFAPFLPEYSIPQSTAIRLARSTGRSLAHQRRCRNVGICAGWVTARGSSSRTF